MAEQLTIQSNSLQSGAIGKVSKMYNDGKQLESLTELTLKK
jgi:hypothetical protein